MTAFLSMGLELEDMQQHIVAQTRESTLTLNGESSVHKRRLAFFKKVKTFHGLQSTYMPGVKALIEEADAKHDLDEPAPLAKEMTLWLLSHVPENEHAFVCEANLCDMEYKLREGQCANALTSLCTHLFAWQHLIKYRNANVTGQRMSTHAQTMIDLVSDKINTVATKYRTAQDALKNLQGESSCGRLRVLQNDDIAPVQEANTDDKAKKKLGRLGGRNSRSQKTKVSNKNMSRIWTEAGGPDEDASVFLHESVHVEWSKAWARWERWCEKVKLLHEEMRHVLQSLRWEADMWHHHGVQTDPGANDAIRRGRRVYAMKQAWYKEQVMHSFKSLWGMKPAQVANGIDRGAEESDSDAEEVVMESPDV
ncbi:hypothetical protein EV421DRAFT_1914723 [Armillaria borealis]|uniref:Uncharacterized protein n=1 Tax=Armillaria borealis TaxID=47425 RepID=A0AA39M5R3_9AGAR|nr:hypothetical protein EV421DRAFT_1914723 [Armillaria borealis]